MADEEKDRNLETDEEVIVIEDEEEQGGQKEEEQLEERPEEEDTEEELEDLKQILMKKNKLPFVAAVAVVFVIVAAVAYFFILKPKPAPPKPKKIEHITEKPKPKLKPKPKPVRPEKYNPIVDVHFLNAMRLQQRGFYRQAINQLKQATVDLYISYYGIGYVYLLLGDLKKAKEYLFDKTKDYLLLAVHDNPDYIEGYVNLFRIYMADGDYKNALRMIDILKQKGVDSDDLKLMEIYYSFVKDSKAEKIFKFTKIYKNSPLVYSLAGDLLLKQNKPDQAKNYFIKALKLYPLGSIYYNLALLYVQNGLYEKATKLLNKMYYMDFSKIPCKNYLGFFLLFKQNKFKAANSFLQLNGTKKLSCYNNFKIIPKVRNPLSLESYLLRSTFNYMLAAQILASYLEPVDLPSSKVNPFIKLGQVYKSIGLPKKAAEELSKAAVFSEAVLLTEYAKNFYITGDYKKSLAYYRMALQKIPTNPLILYDVALLDLKNFKINEAKTIFLQLISSYEAFPLPYLGMFIVSQIEGKHMDSMKYLNAFSQRTKSLSNQAMKKLKDLNIFANYVLNRENFNNSVLNKLDDYNRMIFGLFKAALSMDVDYLYINQPFEKSIHLNWDPETLENLCEFFFKHYNIDFVKRLMTTVYLIDGKPAKAYQALYNLQKYTAADYYKLGVAYLLSGYPDIADNFFTKSILKGANFFNSYVAKAIIQAQKGSLTGVKYYLKIILKKEAKFAWLDTDIFLDYDIKLQ